LKRILQARRPHPSQTGKAPAAAVCPKERRNEHVYARLRSELNVYNPPAGTHTSYCCCVLLLLLPIAANATGRTCWGRHPLGASLSGPLVVPVPCGMLGVLGLRVPRGAEPDDLVSSIAREGEVPRLLSSCEYFGESTKANERVGGDARGQTA